MKQHGQIFSLDLVVSIVVLVIAISIAMQFLELKQIEAKETIMQQELEQVGNTAAELLASNPAFSCEVKSESGTTIYFLPNCVKITAITKAELGIPNNYSCKIDGLGPSITICKDNPDAENVFSVERKIVVSAVQTIRKADLYACMDSVGTTTCSLLENTVKIMVWKT